MPIVREAVRAVRVHYVCDACGVGNMKPNGITLLSHPPQYVHQCNHCGAEESFRGETYPQVVYETIPTVIGPAIAGG